MFIDYLLSNNHVNSIIVHKFDFSDEEIMAYYISFLKTLSLKLNNHTVHFFYNEVRPLRNHGCMRENTEGCNDLVSKYIYELYNNKKGRMKLNIKNINIKIV